MANVTVSHVAILSMCYILYRLISSLITRRRFDLFAKQNDCKDPQDISGSFLSGFQRIKRIMKLQETGEDFMDDIVVPDFQDASTIKIKTFDGAVLLSTIEPANVQALLATQFKDFEAGERRYNWFKPVLGRSIFTSDGKFWEHSRTIFRPQFARENINDLEMTNRAARDLITAIGSTDANGWTRVTEMMPLLYNFTLDTATDFLFGESIESQTAATAVREGQEAEFEVDLVKATKLADAKNFSASMNTINEYVVFRIRMQSFWWLGDGFKFRKAVQTVLKFADHYVQLATDTAASSIKGRGKKDSLLNNLANQTQDRNELRNQTLSILFAGRDTTSALLGWCFVRLALHPDIFSKLRDIVVRDFRPEEEMTFEKLKNCRYLQHFLNEVLRLHPTIPLNQRVAVKDTTLPVGGNTDQLSPIAVRKGQIVMFSVYAMHRRTDLWGSDALDFRPERWEERRSTTWQFLPFLGGPRICLGQQFALTEASFLLCKVLQEFDAIEPFDRAEMAKMKKSLGVTMWPDEGARVRLHKAEV